MRFSSLLGPALAISQVVATADRLFAAVADGTVQTLFLDGSKLIKSSNLTGCGSSPSWLTLTPDFLYCSSEATPGSLSSFQYCSQGELTPTITVSNTTGGDVSSAVFGNQGQFIALAHYGHSSISTYSLPLQSSTQQQLQNLSLPFPGQGPVADRQDKGYPHQVIVDPSGKLLFSPDLGADFIRVFSINSDTGVLKQVTEIKLPPGSGPRHAAFYKSTTGVTYVYIVCELANTLYGYRMDLDSGSDVPTFTATESPGYTVPPGANLTAIALAEIHVSGSTLTTSNRGDTSLGTDSNTLTVFHINDNDGTLGLVNQFRTGGLGPRSFAITKDGKRLAVGNQLSKTIVVFDRNPDSGSLNEIANLALSAQVVDVIWME